MILSDISVKRPVFATVVSIMLVAFGVLSFMRLPVRELPSTDVPIISVSTVYTGASPEVIESRITKVIEDQVAGIEGVDHITSTSRQDRSSVTVYFTLDRNIDLAFNDMQVAVERISAALPREADKPRLSKMDSDAFSIIWFTLASDTMNKMELSDYAQKYVMDRISQVDGVAQVQGGNETVYSMRVWVDRVALAARGLTVTDITRALQSENVELPAGVIESTARDFPVRISRSFSVVEDFQSLVIGEGDDGHLIRLAEVADVKVAPRNEKMLYRGNKKNQLAIGVVKQSTANALEVARGVKEEVAEIAGTLPEGIVIDTSFDTTIFVEKAIEEVQRTLLIAIGLVVLVIFFFIGSLRAALVPAIVVPVSLMATFGVLDMMDYSINLMTLLALVLCIGLVVDDSIVVLENIQRRVDLGEPPILAAYRGARQVAFAVIATTLVIVAVFAPLIFTEGFVGRIFGELGATIAGAVIISSFVALTLSPMMCSKLLAPHTKQSGASVQFFKFFEKLKAWYLQILRAALPHSWLAAPALLAIVALVTYMWSILPQELSPAEDRGLVNVNVTAPQGTGFDYMTGQAEILEGILMSFVDKGVAERMSIRVPGGWGANSSYNTARGMVVLKDWSERDISGHVVVGELQRAIGQLPGVRGFAGMQQGMVSAWGPPVQFVISGANYDEVSEWAEILVAEAQNNRGLMRVDTDYKPNKPQLQIDIDRERAADLGVSSQVIGETLEIMLGSRKVTTYLYKGEEYDVILQGRDEDRREPNDLTNMFVRADRVGAGAGVASLIPLSNLVSLKEIADTAQRRRWNRLQSVTVSAFLSPGYSMGEAINFMETTLKDKIPVGPKYDFNGESRRFMEQGSALLFIFGLALLVVFLVLAAQFESFVHPFIIMLTVPVAIAGALLGLYAIGSSINIYSQIGMIILVGIAAKNGILIVEFANQLRDEGLEFSDALLKASETRFRPIIMTGMSTAAGAIPLLVAMGPGSASRLTIGIVIMVGVLVATAMTLFIVPLFYNLLARRTGSPGTIARKLAEFELENKGTAQEGPARISPAE